jgi:hypothetical protein
MALALSLLRDPVLGRLITGEGGFEDLPAVQARLARDPGETLMHRIRYDSGALPMYSLSVRDRVMAPATSISRIL